MTAIARCVAAVVLLAFACTLDGSESSPRPDGPAVDASGVVVPTSLLAHADLLDLSRASEVPADDAGDEILVVGEEGADPRADAVITVTSYDLAVENEFNYFEFGYDRAEIGGRPALLGPLTFAAARCRSDGVAVQLDERRAVQVSGRGVDQDRLMALAEQVALGADGRIALGELPDGLVVLGGIGLGWRQPSDGTVATLAGHFGSTSVLARRLSPQERVVFDALLCPDPDDSLRPEGTAVIADVSGEAPRRIDYGDGEATVGVISQVDQVVLADGDPGLLLAASVSVDPPLSDDAIAGVLGAVEAMPDADFDALAAARDEQLRQQALDAATTEVEASGYRPLVDGVTDGVAWLLASGDTPVNPPGPALCLALVRDRAGLRTQVDQFLPGCVGADQIDGDLTVGAGSAYDLWFGVVSPWVAAVTAELPDGRRVDAAMVDTGDATFPRVAVVVLPSRPASGASGGGSGYSFVELRDGPITFTAAAADGTPVARRRVGTTDCPIPPGCPA